MIVYCSGIIGKPIGQDEGALSGRELGVSVWGKRLRALGFTMI